ncbi:hypothetical protein GF339_05560 [candidate division KSB3 bacterium]|uniref:Permease n=1 Tax=candidate division KSB3 bacterium TaxID=2044937 RepID=A0A9D5Q4Y6_9BACT|nr:hypothetical protein [candidate division KSB3 bacterium]MBD3324030.1 hypothetical protein [candidate division KSB3 bacterium]
MKARKPKRLVHLALLSGYGLFLVGSALTGFEPGKQIGANFLTFAKTMVTIIPCAFLLVGLFDVWIRREVVERHFGEESGWKGYAWAILLAGTVTGGIYVALPVAHSLYKKGAHLGPLFTYIGASAICRVPMTTFEASFLGLRFTATRFLVSLPLVILTSLILGKYLTKRGYTMEDTG